MVQVIWSKEYTDQGLWYGKLAPSSRQKGKSSHTILCAFNRVIESLIVWGKNEPL